MQALRGSAFGVGTDSGGSVSMPAAFQGSFSIKPSVGRISYRDVAGTVSHHPHTIKPHEQVTQNLC